MTIAAIVAGILTVLVPYLLYGVFLNRVIYFLRVPIYFMGGDQGSLRHFARTDMRLKVPPFWRGKGVQVCLGRLTFQVGRLTMRVDSLETQLGLHIIDIEERQLRSWRTSRAKTPQAESNQ